MKTKLIASALGALLISGSTVAMAESWKERTVRSFGDNPRHERSWSGHDRRDWGHSRHYRHDRGHPRWHGQHRPHYRHHYRHHYGHHYGHYYRHHGGHGYHSQWSPYRYDRDGVTIIFRGQFN